jgi:hypothetical protein
MTRRETKDKKIFQKINSGGIIKEKIYASNAFLWENFTCNRFYNRNTIISQASVQIFKN